VRRVCRTLRGNNAALRYFLFIGLESFNPEILTKTSAASPPHHPFLSIEITNKTRIFFNGTLVAPVINL